jgi:hypothetical protein
MRAVALVPIAVLLAGCWSPGPGQRDPARYPWDPKGAPAKPAPPPAPAPMIEAHGAIPRSTGPAGLEAEQPQVQPAPGIESSQPAQRPPDGTYCVVALEPATTGIVISGNPGAMQTDCSTVQPHRQ